MIKIELTHDQLRVLEMAFQALQRDIATTGAAIAAQVQAQMPPPPAQPASAETA